MTATTVEAEFSTAIRGSSWSTDTWTGVLRHDEVRLIISDLALRPSAL